MSSSFGGDSDAERLGALAGHDLPERNGDDLLGRYLLLFQIDSMVRW